MKKVSDKGKWPGVVERDRLEDPSGYFGSVCIRSCSPVSCTLSIAAKTIACARTSNSASPAAVVVAGAIMGLQFRVTYRDLPRIQVECDILSNSQSGDGQGPRPVYRHAFADTGCENEPFVVDLAFSTAEREGSSWTGVTLGCDRVRLLFRRGSESDIVVQDVLLRTDNCKQGWWKVGARHSWGCLCERMCVCACLHVLCVATWPPT